MYYVLFLIVLLLNHYYYYFSFKGYLLHLNYFDSNIYDVSTNGFILKKIRLQNFLQILFIQIQVLDSIFLSNSFSYCLYVSSNIVLK